MHFSMHYCEELVMSGRWDELEAYLFGFTKLTENRWSIKIFFEIRKQKYLEALDKCAPRRNAGPRTRMKSMS